MAKRNAVTDLNHDNWEAVEEKEEAGQFIPLSKDQLQNRVIKRAKRTLNVNSSTNSPSAGSSPFARFSGFASSVASSSLQKTDSNNPFSSIVKKEPETSNGKETTSEDKVSLGNSDDATKLSSNTTTTPQPKQARGIEYYRQLQSLNESVLKWMQLHLVKNSCCDFTPVFNDYRKHLDSLNVTYPVQKKEGVYTLSKDSVFKQPSNLFAKNKNSIPKESPMCKTEKNQDDNDYGAHFKSNTTNTSTFSSGIKAAPTATSISSSSGPTSSSKEEKNQNESPETKNTPQFSFGYFSKANQASSDNKSFSFSATPTENSIQSPGFFSTPFKVNNDKPFSFACAPNENSAAESKSDKDGEEYVPPKSEFVSDPEEGAFYSKRCKLFIKRDDSYADKGIAMLHLKSLEEKTQLLIRDGSKLGYVLLNIKLSSTVPISRTGKNNVLLTCVPNPPIDAKNPDSKETITFLIRVKTSEDADELLEKLNENKS